MKKRGGNPITHILVDGYNIIHAWPALRKQFKQSIDAAIQTLTTTLQPIHDNETLRLTIVFDGKGEDIQVLRPFMDCMTFSVLFSPSGTSADTLIEQLVQNSIKKNPIIVATEDRLLIETTSALGAVPLSPEGLSDWVNRAQKAQTTSIQKHKKSTQKQWQQHDPWKELKNLD